MANRYAKPVKVPRLNEKLQLLYQSSTGVDGDAALGRLFRSAAEPRGITGKAVRLWVYGDKSRSGNMVPAERFERFVEIVQKRLPGDRTAEETRALLTSPSAADLADAFRSSAPAVDWVTLVQSAPPAAVTILLHNRRGVFSVTARRRALEGVGGQVTCPVSHYFQFKLHEVSEGWLTLLQWGQSGWFGLELADEVVSLGRTEYEGLLPSSPPYYLEDEPGVRRYLFITTPTPLAPDLLSKLTTSARANAPLDVATLDRLAHLAGRQRGFGLSTLDVSFYRRGEA